MKNKISHGDEQRDIAKRKRICHVCPLPIVKGEECFVVCMSDDAFGVFPVLKSFHVKCCEIVHGPLCVFLKKNCLIQG